MDARLAIGLSIQPSTGDACAALVRVHGVGWACQVESLSSWVGPVRPGGGPAGASGPAPAVAPRVAPIADPSEIAQQLADAVSVLIQRAATALDQVLLLSLRAVDRPGSTHTTADIAAHLAELAETTTIAGFGGLGPDREGRDKALTALADWVIAHDLGRPRLVIHLDRVTTISHLPGASEYAGVRSFDVGPGGGLLESLLIALAPDHRQPDPRGLLAVQGRQIKPLIRHWAAHPFLRHDSPQSLDPAEFAGPFIDETVQLAVERNWALTDVLCTATHFIAACPADAVRRFLGREHLPSQVVCVGAGTQNGFLLRLLEEQFTGLNVQTVSLPKIATVAYDAVAAAVLGCLALDGAATLVPCVGGSGNVRLLGHLVPGSAPNWRRCIEWMHQATQVPHARAA